MGRVPSTNSILDRYLGLKKALIEQGLPYKDTLVLEDRNELGEMIEVLLPKELPSAFLCNNDHSAYLLIKKLIKQGYKVPEDISIIGFDDVIYSKISSPQITTMKVSRKYMAEQAVNLMLRRIHNKKAKLINMTLECLMVERDSVKEHKGV